MADEKKAKKDEKESASKGRLAEWYAGIAGEFKRITWPGRSELVKLTASVIITSGIIGGIIVGYDTILAAAYNLLVSAFGGN